jgi:hypothetical protein
MQAVFLGHSLPGCRPSSLTCSESRFTSNCKRFRPTCAPGCGPGCQAPAPVRTGVTPTRAVSIPYTPAVSEGFAPSGSVPRGSRTVSPSNRGSLTGNQYPCLSGWALPSSTAAHPSGPSDQRPNQRAPSDPRAVRVPACPRPFARLPRISGIQPPAQPTGPAAGQASSTTLPGPPEAESDPGPRLSTGASSTGPQPVSSPSSDAQALPKADIARRAPWTARPANLQTLPTAGRPGHATSTSPTSPLGAYPDPGTRLRPRGASSTGKQVR